GTPWGLAQVTLGSTTGGSVPPTREALDCETADAVTLRRLLASIAACWGRAHAHPEASSSGLAACREVGVSMIGSLLGRAVGCPTCARARASHLGSMVVDGLYGVLDQFAGCDAAPLDSDSCPAASNAALLEGDLLACRADSMAAGFRRAGFSLEACDGRAR